MEDLLCDIVFTAQESENRNYSGEVAVVIDVFRATTSIVSARIAGASEVKAVAEVDTARLLKGQMPEALLCGERSGVALEGFDMGNSPVAFANADLSGESIILTTTNGTRAIESATSSRVLLVGAMANARAVAGAVFETRLPVTFVCAGTEGRFSIEDVYAAGLMILRLIDSKFQLTDAAWAACALAARPVEEIITPQTCRHYARLLEIGFEDDIAYALKADTSVIVPRMDSSGWIV